MPTWLYALVVFGFGLGLALLVDRMLGRSGSVPGESEPQTRIRSKWLYYWYKGRFPTEKELDEREGEDREGEEKKK